MGVKNKLIVVSCIMSLLLHSCGEDLEQGQKELEIKRYYPNGQIEFKAKAVGDSSNLNGLAHRYFNDGSVNSELNFLNGKLNGAQRFYTESGELESIKEYENGIMEGTLQWYYKNGKLYSDVNIIDGLGYGRVDYYYENGIKKSYGCVDILEKTFYLIKWNEEGKKIEEIGRAFSENYEFLPGASPSMRIIKVAVAEPPKRKTVIMVGEVGQPLKEIPINNFSISIKAEVNKEVVIKGVIKDLNDKILLEDADTIKVGG